MLSPTLTAYNGLTMSVTESTQVPQADRMIDGNEERGAIGIIFSVVWHQFWHHTMLTVFSMALLYSLGQDHQKMKCNMTLGSCDVLTYCWLHYQWHHYTA